MFGTMKGRILTIVAVLALAGFYLYHNGIKLGLDLQGGMHLALEVVDSAGTMTPEKKADATNRALEVIRNRINQFGVEEPIIQKSDKTRIIVELAGIRDPARAKSIIEQTAFLQFLMVQDGRKFMAALPRIDRAVVEAVGAKAVKAATGGAPAANSQQQAMKLLFGTDTAAADSAKAAGKDTSAVAAATASDTSLHAFSGLLLQSGTAGEYLVSESDVPLINKYLALPTVKRLLPNGTELLWKNETEGKGAALYRRLYLLNDRPFMTGESLEDAQAGRDPQFNQTIVTFQLNRRGGHQFQRVTSQHIGDMLAIVLDSKVFSAPVIQSTIGARGQIELGQAPLSEAQDLALVLRAGALPAPLHVVQESTVGPSLGADSVFQGKIAFGLGIVLVILIMIGYYRFAGLLAVLGLVAYVIIVLGGLAGFRATLTAPGIAGFILSIGMGVDANVLIFERTREELAAGRSIRVAVDLGFQEAMSAIIDTHLTTLITALVLYYVGTGPVRGFAVTLSVGIVASFFSAVFVTRTLFLIYLQHRRNAAASLSI